MPPKKWNCEDPRWALCECTAPLSYESFDEQHVQLHHNHSFELVSARLLQTAVCTQLLESIQTVALVRISAVLF